MPFGAAAKRRIILTLSRHPLHGYQIAAEAKVPLTGVYQHLKDLRNEGLIIATLKGRRKVYSLTTRGKKLADVLRD